MNHKIIKDNLILITGGLLGNIFSFAINFLLIRYDPVTANLYVFYNTISIILAFPSLILLRILSVYGWKVLYKILHYFKKYLFLNILSIAFVFSILIVSIYFFSYEKNIFFSFYTLILSILSIIAYALRGLHNYDLNFHKTIISFNIETGGRLLLGYILGIILDMNIHGWFIGSILSMLLSLLPLYKKNFLINKKINFNETGYQLKQIILGSFILSLGLEIIINLDIAIVIANLTSESDRTDFNMLQIFRKIIFHGTITIMPFILSMSQKNKSKNYLMFLYTLLVSLVISTIIALTIFTFKNLFFIIINRELANVANFELLFFMISCIHITIGYLISNWLFGQNKFWYNIIPIINVLILIIILTNTTPILRNYILSIFYFSFIFLISNVLISIYHIRKHKYG